MASRAFPAIEPEAVLSELVAPLGAIVASVNDRDLRNDKAAKLSRRGLDGLASCLTPERYALLKPLLVESPEVGKAKWTQGKASSCFR